MANHNSEYYKKSAWTKRYEDVRQISFFIQWLSAFTMGMAIMSGSLAVEVIAKTASTALPVLGLIGFGTATCVCIGGLVDVTNKKHSDIKDGSDNLTCVQNNMRWVSWLLMLLSLMASLAFLAMEILLIMISAPILAPVLAMGSVLGLTLLAAFVARGATNTVESKLHMSIVDMYIVKNGEKFDELKNALVKAIGNSKTDLILKSVLIAPSGNPTEEEKAKAKAKAKAIIQQYIKKVSDDMYIVRNPFELYGVVTKLKKWKESLGSDHDLGETIDAALHKMEGHQYRNWCILGVNIPFCILVILAIALTAFPPALPFGLSLGTVLVGIGTGTLSITGGGSIIAGAAVLTSFSQSRQKNQDEKRAGMSRDLNLRAVEQFDPSLNDRRKSTFSHGLAGKFSNKAQVFPKGNTNNISTNQKTPGTNRV